MNCLIRNFCLITLLCGGAYAVSAQSASYRMDIPYIIPKTAIKVKLTVEQEVIKKGPYAKFAQQYLGITAPLNDKVNYKIVEAALSGYDEADLSNIYMLNNPAAAPVDMIGKKVGAIGEAPVLPHKKREGVNKLLFSDMGSDPVVFSPSSSYSVDRLSMREKSLDEMAADAANTIYTLRKRRFDLVTGEMGDAVFGAGLKAAIEEINRLEVEYLSLFVGKKAVVTKVYEYDVVPVQGQNNYVVCRFSEMNGIVDAMDVSGEPVLLTVTPEGGVTASPEKKTVVKGAVYYRVADMAQCNLFNGTALLGSSRIPVLQYGTTVEVSSVK